ncbi:reverse transcriptase domain-containing protein, partial [Tanacetum coccineum]
MTITRSGMTLEAIKELISQRVAEALAAQEANRNAGLVVESQSQNGDDDDDNGNEGNGNHGNNNEDGNRNGGNGGARRNAPIAKDCTYKDYLNCQLCNFSRTKGDIGLARWFVKIESVFRISNFPSNSQVKFATCTLLDGALTWWNSHVQTIGIDEAYEMPLKDLMKLMIDMYYPRTEIQKIVPEEDDKIETVVAAQTPRAHMVNQRVVTGFGYGGQGHYKSDCPKLKNRNRGNKATNNDAHMRAYALGGGNGNPNSNVITDMFLLNNRYAYILFDSSVDRSFISTMFSALIDITPIALDVSYTVELADRRIVGSDAIIRGCTLNLLDHPFNIDLIPVNLGSFDVIIGMDWLS